MPIFVVFQHQINSVPEPTTSKQPLTLLKKSTSPANFLRKTPTGLLLSVSKTWCTLRHRMKLVQVLTRPLPNGQRCLTTLSSKTSAKSLPSTKLFLAPSKTSHHAIIAPCIRLLPQQVQEASPTVSSDCRIRKSNHITTDTLSKSQLNLRIIIITDRAILELVSYAQSYEKLHFHKC